MRLFCLFILVLLLSLNSRKGYAQLQHAPNDTIRLGGVIVGKDTFAMVFLDEVEVLGKMPRHIAKQRERMIALKYNVVKVYPYAVAAAEVLKDVDMNLDRFGDDKSARKAYIKDIEKKLNARWKGELQNLTISQGQILVKLINRQTGRNCFEIIKEMKGGFRATVYQGIALLFSNNLRHNYDPNGDDAELEQQVRDLEASLYYRYKATHNHN
ncbi:MAG: DUF4294 domain-containing protein [Bacteroidetes bacterium]|nr:DUF4294 domain-containing protein [Bacteroidota bacterium]